MNNMMVREIRGAKINPKSSFKNQGAQNTRGRNLREQIRYIIHYKKPPAHLKLVSTSEGWLSLRWRSCSGHWATTRRVAVSIDECSIAVGPGVGSPSQINEYHVFLLEIKATRPQGSTPCKPQGQSRPVQRSLCFYVQQKCFSSLLQK